MMIDIEKYITKLIQLLSQSFGDRLIYVGLQGSYLRGEATQQSDVDIMVVIDELRVQDLTTYRTAIQTLEHFDRSCGFICSKRDITCWNPLEIGHLLNTTKDYYGTLCGLVPAYTETDMRNFVKMSVNNLYHEISHRYIHANYDKNVANLPRSYKSVFFILQNLYYLTHGKFVNTKAELLSKLDGKDHAVLKHAIEINQYSVYNFEENFTLLFEWCQNVLQRLA